MDPLNTTGIGIRSRHVIEDITHALHAQRHVLGKGRQIYKVVNKPHPPGRRARWVRFLPARPPRHWSPSIRASLRVVATTARTLHAEDDPSLSCCRPCTLHRTPTSQVAPSSSGERSPDSRGSSPPSSFPGNCVNRPVRPTIVLQPSYPCPRGQAGRGWLFRILPTVLGPFSSL